jgi:hypothetical protein
MTDRIRHTGKDSVLVQNEKRDLEMKDAKGRAIGCIIWVYRFTVVAATENQGWNTELGQYEPGTTLYRVSVQPSRDGSSFGAVTSDAYCETDEQVQAEITRRISGMTKRYRKILGNTSP